jgi:hypothetical protein
MRDGTAETRKIMIASAIWAVSIFLSRVTALVREQIICCSLAPARAMPAGRPNLSVGQKFAVFQTIEDSPILLGEFFIFRPRVRLDRKPRNQRAFRYTPFQYFHFSQEIDSIPSPTRCCAQAPRLEKTAYHQSSPSGNQEGGCRP